MINAVAVRSNEFKDASREFNRGVQIVSPSPRPKHDRGHPNIWAIDPGPTPDIGARSVAVPMGQRDLNSGMSSSPIDNEMIVTKTNHSPEIGVASPDQLTTETVQDEPT
jgi:hypothetical protein